MTSDQMDRITLGRLARWRVGLREQGATPMLLFGLKMPENDIILLTMENVDQARLAKLLIRAALLIEEGNVTLGPDL